MEEIKRGEILPVLIVEDNHEDYESILRVFKKLGIANALYRCENGTDALDFIHQRNSYGTDAKAPRPGIVLLDLNLPGTDGREVLKEIKTDPHLKSIPVVVLTTSDSDRDISECYLNGANSYMTKPGSWDDFFRTMEHFKNYWLETAILPNHPF